MSTMRFYDAHSSTLANICRVAATRFEEHAKALRNPDAGFSQVEGALIASLAAEQAGEEMAEHRRPEDDPDSHLPYNFRLPDALEDPAAQPRGQEDGTDRNDQGINAHGWLPLRKNEASVFSLVSSARRYKAQHACY